MRTILPFLLAVAMLAACDQATKQPGTSSAKSTDLGPLLDNYYKDRLQLFPVEATINGDTNYNNLLPAGFTDSYIQKLKEFFTRYQQQIADVDTSALNDNDKKSVSILAYEMRVGLQGLAVNFVGSSAVSYSTYMPFDQFNGVPLLLGQMGSGTGVQPFKTEKDYRNWLERAGAFKAWSDSAITYFRKGIAKSYVLPKSIVIKMIPQLRAMRSPDVKSNLFYGPVKLFPKTFSDSVKKQLTTAFELLIRDTLMPAYANLATFLETEYLPKARSTTGVNALPGGDSIYAYLVKFWTTTKKPSNEIYQTGLAEVRRIRVEMERIKSSVQFTGTLDSFFTYMKTGKQFMPFKTPAEVIATYQKMQATIDPNLQKMFGRSPKTAFEIRQTEAFRAASASAEYYAGLPDGSRPGIFYVPIVDATKFNTTSGMESLFLHEAIPGHHYQVSLQNENTALPSFRRFIWYGAYGEGYALYCESLGKELGLYTDPYQEMGALGDEIHRAIRLVVDVAMHTGKMTREEAISYMMANEAISEEGAVAEIERYMVYPAQALSYKTGALKIRELRDKYSKQLGSKFKLAAFHDELLSGGCMPLAIVEQGMDNWASRQQ